MGFTKHLDVNEMRTKLNEIWDELESIQDFGHVGCYEMTSDKVEEEHKNNIQRLNEVISSLEEINSAIKESYEY